MARQRRWLLLDTSFLLLLLFFFEFFKQCQPACAALYAPIMPPVATMFTGPRLYARGDYGSRRDRRFRVSPRPLRRSHAFNGENEHGSDGRCLLGSCPGWTCRLNRRTVERYDDYSRYNGKFKTVIFVGISLLGIYNFPFEFRDWILKRISKNYKNCLKIARSSFSGDP